MVGLEPTMPKRRFYRPVSLPARRHPPKKSGWRSKITDPLECSANSPQTHSFASRLFYSNQEKYYWHCQQCRSSGTKRLIADKCRSRWFMSQFFVGMPTNKRLTQLEINKMTVLMLPYDFYGRSYFSLSVSNYDQKQPFIYQASP